MKIHILTDDKTRRRGYLAEHGLSLLIQHHGHSLLFDTGQSDVFVKNANRLGLNISAVSNIILSHGHYDHCGGLTHFPKGQAFPKVYVHKDAFIHKYARESDGSYREIGIPWAGDAPDDIQNSLVLTSGATMLDSDMAIMGDIPSATNFEDIPTGLYVGDETRKSKDMFQDEQMLIIRTDRGLCLFLGCSHPGVVNGCLAAQTLFPGEKVYALFAGMHLESAETLRIHLSMQALRDMDIAHIYPLHCTGIPAICEMKRFFGDRCDILYAGDCVEL